jgi:hypothetical protein
MKEEDHGFSHGYNNHAGGRFMIIYDKVDKYIIKYGGMTNTRRSPNV